MTIDRTSSPNRLTAVLPLRINHQNATTDLERICRLLLPSFEKYWIEKEQLEFLFIVSPPDKSELTNCLKDFNSFAFRIITDDELCPTLSDISGWHKQQILKLESSHVVQTECFLVLDADNILIKPVSYGHLFPDQKPIFQQESAGLHWNWWLASKSVLKSGISLERHTLVIGVTPEILYKDICIGLLKEIALRNQVTSASEYLLSISQSCEWTEYSLYWLYVLENGLTVERYPSSGVQLYEGIWLNAQFRGSESKAINTIFHKSSAFFLAVQSTLQIEPAKIARLIFPPLHSPAILVFFFYSLTNRLLRFVRRVFQ